MRSITIKEDYALRNNERKLQFDDDRPVVIGYCRVSESPHPSETEEAQMADISRACGRLFGLGGYNIIWIVEYDKTKRGVHLARELLTGKRAQCLVVQTLTRFTRKYREWLELEDLVQSVDGEAIIALQYLRKHEFDTLVQLLVVEGAG